MAKKKVTVDANYREVKADSGTAAYVFNAEDERLDKYRKAAAGNPAIPVPVVETIAPATKRT